MRGLTKYAPAFAIVVAIVTIAIVWLAHSERPASEAYRAERMMP